MKQLILSIIIVVVILSLGVFTIKTIGKEAENLNTLLIEIENSVYDDNWAEANIVSESIEELWDKYKKEWPMLIDHLEIDNLSSKLAELRAYITSSNKDETLAKVAALKILVKHIPEKESFIIQNIL
ncbi:MAG: DUF4363 family protein [Clostridiales bacterium]|jgi:hypothetical protein|nr:DUF4363 family protein [Clostridiales bacterium]